MGRLGRDFSQRPKKGKGRKSRKQPAPEFPNLDLKKELGKTVLRRQKKREAKKIAKTLQIEDESKAGGVKVVETTPGGEIDWLPDDMMDPEELHGAQPNGADLPNLALPGLSASEDETNASMSDDDVDNDGIEVADEFLSSESEDTGDEQEEASSDEMEIEKASKKIEKKRKAMKHIIDLDNDSLEEDAESETEEDDVGESAEDESRLELNLDTEMPSEKPGQVLNHDELLERIQANLDAFRNPKGQAAQGQKRSDVRSQLVADLSTYYGYNEYLTEKFLDLFPGEVLEALDANEVDRPMTIRANTLVTRRRDLAQALMNRGVNLDSIGKWSHIGLVIFDSKIPIGATPEYLAGQYIIQGGSSLLPVMALGPKENERVLDICAAPGGKTTHIAQLMRNTGSIIANDIHKERCTALAANVHRMAITNTAVCCLDGRHIPKFFNDFDRVLLDAPCSGTGVISKDPSCKTSRDEKDIKRTAHVQRELLLAAIDACDAKKPSEIDGSSGGIIVYSTCSVLVEENEDVVSYALRKRHVKLVETDLEFGEDGFTRFGRFHFPPQMKLCKRYYPHTNNLDGFFVAKLFKYSNEKKGAKEDNEKASPDAIDVSDDSDNQTAVSTKRPNVSSKKSDRKKPKNGV